MTENSGIRCPSVMAGRVPAICASTVGVDGRDTPGHDDRETTLLRLERTFPVRPGLPTPSLPSLHHESFKHTGQFSEIGPGLQPEDEVQDGVVGLLVHNTGDDTPVLGDYFVLRQ